MEELSLQKALNERSLTISNLPEKGRCLFTTRDFFPGEVIISEDPYVSVPNKNKESPESKCEWCFTKRNLKKCSACHVVWYCSSSCQKSDWRLHSTECKTLSKVDKERVKSLTPSIRLMVKLYLHRKLENEKVFPVTAMENYKYVEALVSHMSEVEENQLVLYAQMANLVHLILQWPESEIDLKEIAEIFSKLACNAHTICDSELRPLGTGLYPVISIINHSCSPNSVLGLAVVRAMDHIPKGSEVLISDVEIAGSTVNRQKTLKEQYFFHVRVMFKGQPDDIRESAIKEGYRCKDIKCNGFLLRDPDNKGFVCQNCRIFRDKEEIKNIVREMKLISEKGSESLSSGNKTEASVAYKTVEDLQLKLQHPFSINLMQTRETLLKIFMDLEDWTEALKYCKLTIPVYERVLKWSISEESSLAWTAILYLRLLGETEAAVRSLTNASDILRITHGTKTPFVLELMNKLDEARAEASYQLHSCEKTESVGIFKKQKICAGDLVPVIDCWIIL